MTETPTAQLPKEEEGHPIRGNLEAPHVGHLTRNLLADMVRSNDEDAAFDIIERARDAFERNYHQVADSHIPTNPVEPLISTSDQGTSFIHTMEHGILVTLICPPGPIRIGDNVIWIEKKLVPQSLWTRLTVMDHKGRKPSEYAGLKGHDLDKGIKGGITSWEASEIFTGGDVFLLLNMEPVTYPIDEVEAFLREISNTRPDQ